jgi:DNA-binding transcriptional LysR family regulator
MTHDQLAAFVAVATEGTFTLAAVRLHKSQSAISKLVRNLEGELGVLVFNRSGYRVTLTDAGKALLERALSVLEQVRELGSLGRALAGTHEPSVRLAVDAITPLRLVLGVLRGVGQAFPNVRIELSTEHMGGALEVLEEGRVDLAVTSRNVDARSIEAEPFTCVAISAVAHRDHPIARVRGPVPSSALREHPQIVLSDSARKQLGPSINVLEAGLRWNVSDVSAKKEIILAGMGWGGLPRHLVEAELRRGTLVELVVREFRADAIALCLARRRDRSVGRVGRLLWDGLLASGRDAERAKPARRRKASHGRAVAAPRMPNE